MISRSSNILAIALGDDRISCVEAAMRGDAGRVKHAAVFDVPDRASLDRPEELGLALGRFLKENGFDATQVVVGIPIRWVLAQDREVPPMSAADATAMLRLQAEKLAMSGSAEFAFDYAGQASADRATRVLIVGTLRSRLAQVERLAAAAELRVRSVTPTALAVAQRLDASAGDAPLLLVNEGGAEIVWRNGGAPRLVQHVPVSMNGHGRSLKMLGSELRRGVTLGSPGGAARRDAVVLDSVGLSGHELDELSRLGGVELRPASESSANGENQAVALALAAGSAEGLPIDFKRSRLAEPSKQRVGRRSVWAAVLGLLVIGVVLFEVIDFQQQRSELAALEEQSQRIAPDVTAAEATIARTSFGRSFFESRPPALDCLLELTRAFGERQPIWATSLTFRDNGRGQVIGSAADQREVLELLDRMKNTRTLTDVTLLDLREAAGAQNREVAFSITFGFKPASGDAK